MRVNTTRGPGGGAGVIGWRSEHEHRRRRCPPRERLRVKSKMTTRLQRSFDTSQAQVYRSFWSFLANVGNFVAGYFFVLEL